MNSRTSGRSTRAAAKPEPPAIGVGWAGSIGGSTKKSRTPPIPSPAGQVALQHEVGLLMHPALRFGCARPAVGVKHVIELTAPVLVADARQTAPDVSGLETKLSARRPASITAGLVNATSPRVHAS